MNRLRFLTIIISALVLALHSDFVTRALGSLRYYCISYVDGLRLRDKPGVDGKVLGILPKGLLVPRTELDDKPSIINGIKNRWVKVRHGNLEGWVFGGYLVYHITDAVTVPESAVIVRKVFPAAEWHSIGNAVVLTELKKGIRYLDASETVPLYREQPRGTITLDLSLQGKSGLKADFTNKKTVFFRHSNYHHTGEYGATGYFLFNHPDHGKVWVADCHTHQVADTIKWKDTMVLLGTSEPLWEGDRSKYRLMLWNIPGKKFISGTMPFPKVNFTYARAKFLLSQEKDGALHLQMEARNETDSFDPSDDVDMSFTNPFYNLYAVLTESKIVEVSRYEMSLK